MDRHVIRQCARLVPVEKAAWNPFSWLLGTGKYEATPGLQPDTPPQQFASTPSATGFMDPVGQDGKPLDPNVMGSNSTMSKDPVTGWPVRTTTTVTQQGQVRAPMTREQYAEYQRQRQLNRDADNLNLQINDMTAKHRGMRKELDSATSIPNAPAFKSTAPAGYQTHIDKLQAAEKQVSELQEKMKKMREVPARPTPGADTSSLDNLRMRGYSSQGAGMMQQLQRTTTNKSPAPATPAAPASPSAPATPKPAGMPSLGPRGAPGPRKLWTVS